MRRLSPVEEIWADKIGEGYRLGHVTLNLESICWYLIGIKAMCAGGSAVCSGGGSSQHSQWLFAVGQVEFRLAH